MTTHRWIDRVRSDASALAGAPLSAFHELLDEVEAHFERRPPPVFVALASDRPIQVIGDSHGDWPAVSAALAFARRGQVPEGFVALGDFIHRSTRTRPDPAQLPSGSVWNAAFLLAWAVHDPERVVLLRGNHEASRQIPVQAPTLLRELHRAYPDASSVVPTWDRLMGLLERLPLAARTENGVFLVHGGVPPPDRFDRTAWRTDDLRLLEGLLWSDPEVGYEDRSVGFAFDLRRLTEFLDAVDCRLMIRGHSPKLSGSALYGGRALTLHTSDLFATPGGAGVLLAEIPAVPRITSAREVILRSWNGRGWSRRTIRSGSPPAEQEIRSPRSSQTGDGMQGTRRG